MRSLRLWVFAAVLACAPVTALGVTIDFSTDDFGTALVNGQAINTAVMAGDLNEEFGNFVSISSTIIGDDGHLGPAIFDSSPCPGGPNCGSQDPDLLVGLGNILILQNDDSPASTNTAPNGKVFDSPNDEASFGDRGSIVFDFTSPSELISIDLVDINGGNNVILTLEDNSGNFRVFDVPEMWTNDVTVSPNGYDTLLFSVITPQNGEGTGGDATVTTNDPGFDITQVISLDVALVGSPSSGGLDNLVFNLPEPSTSALMLLGLLAAGAARRRSSAS